MKMDERYVDLVAAEIAKLRAQRDELAAALTDAEFLLRQIAINWEEAGSMKDSCARSAEDARAALAKLEKEGE